MEIRDKLGQLIIPGCYIAYGHALGNCSGLRIGKVIKVTKKPITRYHKSEEFEYRITVQGVHDDWSWKAPELTNKKGTLQYPDRIIVLDESAVPEKYTSLLKEVPIEES